MQKLFNNPLVVGALGLVAAAYFAVTVLVPMFGSDANANGVVDVAVPTFEDLATNSAAIDSELPEGLAVDKDRIRWLRSLPRDPFGNRPAQADATGKPVSSNPELQALFTSASSRSAVIDNELVREGDLVRGMEVVAIDNTGVTLASATVTLRLEP